MARDIHRRIEALERQLLPQPSRHRVNVGSAEDIERRAALAVARDEPPSNGNAAAVLPAPEQSPEEGTGDLQFWRAEKLGLVSHHRTRDAARDYAASEQEPDPLAPYRHRGDKPLEPKWP